LSKLPLSLAHDGNEDVIRLSEDLYGPYNQDKIEHGIVSGIRAQVSKRDGYVPRQVSVSTTNWEGFYSGVPKGVFDTTLNTDVQKTSKPDTQREEDFQVEDNASAFTPGQLNRLLDPKSLTKDYALAVADLEEGLRTERKSGLSADESETHETIALEESANTTLASRDHEVDLSSPTVPQQKYFTSNQSLRPTPTVIGSAASERSKFADLDPRLHKIRSQTGLAVDEVVTRLDSGSVLRIMSEELASSVKLKHERNTHLDLSPASITALAAASLAAIKNNGRRALCVIMEGKEYFACPDSGSDKNVMSEEFARSKRLKIRAGAGDKKLFELGNGECIKSVGRVRISCALTRGYLPKKKTWFYILEKCAFPLIIGRQALDAAQLLTKNRRWLEMCPPSMLGLSSLFFIGTPRKTSGRNMSVRLDGRLMKAIADTGSDLNLMSLTCAEREGFRIDRSFDARQLLQVANGTVIETVGSVYVKTLSLDWRQPATDLPELETDIIFDDIQTASHDVEPRELSGEIFHVVDGLPCDLILGESFLFKNDAFNTATETIDQDIFITADAPYKLKVYLHLGAIQSAFCRIGKRKRTGKPPDSTAISNLAQDDHLKAVIAEQHRRSKIRRAIEEMEDGVDKETVQVREDAVVANYEAEHTGCLLCITHNVGTGSTSVSSGAGT